MAKTNSTKAMRADLDTAADMLKGATGFLFAVTMPDGGMKWVAGGNLLGYDNATAGAAMQLYIKAQRAALMAA